MRDHLLGFPAALLPFEPDSKPLNAIAPLRDSVRPKWVACFRLDLTPADTRGHFGEESLRAVIEFMQPARDEGAKREKPADPSAEILREQAAAVWGGVDLSKVPCCSGGSTVSNEQAALERRIAALEAGAAPKAPVADAEGWITHDGGPLPACIVGKDIEVRLRGNVTERSYSGRGTELRWSHDGNGGDIMAYRVID